MAPLSERALSLADAVEGDPRPQSRRAGITPTREVKRGGLSGVEGWDSCVGSENKCLPRGRTVLPPVSWLLGVSGACVLGN